VVVSGSFDDLRHRHVRFLHEASRLGSVRALLWSDEMVRSVTGQAPQFLEEERRYLVSSIRYVDECQLLEKRTDPDGLPEDARANVWAIDAEGFNSARKSFCRSRGIDCRVIPEARLEGTPVEEVRDQPPSGRRKVIVTGCYDWLHSGHVRFFEEAAEYGDLYVGVGHDANIRLLKGPRHPLFPQEMRRYMVGAVRHVTRAVITSGSGWLDAAPEIDALKPDVYVTNRDGDNEEKRAFCRDRGLLYVVLNRLPRQGLPARTSTSLRSF
jgi:cytidyltransferase-like protein